MGSLSRAKTKKEVNAMKKLLGNGWKDVTETHRCESEDGRKFNEYYPALKKGQVVLRWLTPTTEFRQPYRAAIDSLRSPCKSPLVEGCGDTYLEAFKDLSKKSEKYISDLLSEIDKITDTVNAAQNIYLDEIFRAKQKS